MAFRLLAEEHQEIDRIGRRGGSSRTWPVIGSAVSPRATTAELASMTNRPSRLRSPRSTGGLPESAVRRRGAGAPRPGRPFSRTVDSTASTRRRRSVTRNSSSGRSPPCRTPLASAPRLCPNGYGIIACLGNHDDGALRRPLRATPRDHGAPPKPRGLSLGSGADPRVAEAVPHRGSVRGPGGHRWVRCRVPSSRSWGTSSSRSCSTRRSGPRSARSTWPTSSVACATR